MEQFYCVKCDRLAGIDRAVTLFRTGYFRIEHRLGFCQACGSNQDRGSRHDKSAESERSPFIPRLL